MIIRIIVAEIVVVVLLVEVDRTLSLVVREVSMRL